MALPREVFEKLVFYKKEIDRIWNQYYRPGRQEGLSMAPAPFDIYETEDAIHVDVELPGVRAEELELSALNDVLMIQGVRTRAEEGPARFHQAERSYGAFSRLIELPRPANMGRLEATLDHGLLEIRIPKVEDRRRQWRRIEVRERGGR